MISPFNKIFISALLLLFSTSVVAADNFLLTAQGAKYKDLKTGSGETAEAGDVVTIHFTGWLDSNGIKGKEIYNSRKENKRVSFVVGTDKVMPGWNEGVIGMKQGGKRLIMLPANLGYGAKGVEKTIPPNARLIFMFDLLQLEK